MTHLIGLNKSIPLSYSSYLFREDKKGGLFSMLAFIAENLWEIFFGLVSAGALAFCKHLHGKNKKLEEMQKADQTRQQRQMILDEIEPIIQELTSIHSEIT